MHNCANVEAVYPVNVDKMSKIAEYFTKQIVKGELQQMVLRAGLFIDKKAS